MIDTQRTGKDGAGGGGGWGGSWGGGGGQNSEKRVKDRKVSGWWGSDIYKLKKNSPYV